LVRRGAPRSVSGQSEQGPKFSTSVFEKVGSSVIVTDLAGKITYWNKRAEEMRGWKSEEVIGKPILDLMPPESRELASAIMKKVAQSGSWIGEFEVIRKNGTRFPTMSSDTTLEDWNGRMVGIIDVSVDVTERKQMERRLHESEERFRGIAERSFDGIFTTDSKGIYTYVSPAFAKLFGLDPSEMTGKSILERVRLRLESESEQDRFLQIFKDVLSGKSVEASAFQIRRMDGSLAFFEANASPVIERGKVTGVEAVVRDITERKQMEKRVTESEEKFRGIAERSFDGIFIVDTKGNTTYASPSLYRILGLKPEDVLGAPVTKNLPGAAVPKVVKATGEVLRGGTIEALEVETRKKDGSPVFLEVNASPVFGEGHSVVGIQGVVRDVTERNRAEEAKRLLASVVQATPVGSVTLDLDGTIIGWNPAAEKMFGYSAEEIIGSSGIVLAPRGGAEAAARFRESIKKLTSSQDELKVEGTGARKDGTDFDFSADAFPIKDAHGKTVRIGSFFTDVTEQKAAEDKIRDLQEARSRFILAATHELKTPLVSIKGYADLAVSGSLGELSKPLEHGLSIVGRNVDRMLSLIQELLEIERIENGQVKVLKEVVDMSEVINESVENLKPIMRGKQLEVDLVLPEAAPLVMGDKVRLDEVMDNLLVNAVKFTPEKGKLRVVLTEEAGKVSVSVADSGIGISPTNLQNLFEPFSKIPKSGFVENQAIFGLYSTGLGLALTKRLVELHGGRIWAESPGEGQGSTFFFSLPRIQQ